jgi:hypothetical protein
MQELYEIISNMVPPIKQKTELVVADGRGWLRRLVPEKYRNDAKHDQQKVWELIVDKWN